jgi:predicted nuclease of predicted toxin-antitoxin system
MRILIDECVDPRVKRLFDDEVKTVHQMGWDTLKDGRLFQLAQERFDVFLTIDRNLEHQQNLKKFSLGFVVVQVPKNQLRFFEQIRDELRTAVSAINPGEVVHIAVKSERPD